MSATPLLARPSHPGGSPSFRSKRGHVPAPAIVGQQSDRWSPARDAQANSSYHADVSGSIKDYEVGDLLGTGGFGYVYRARSRHGHHGGRDVAIKMINKQKMTTENLRRRVINEVEIHWQLRHRSILELYNYFEDRDHVYLVMELCTGGELYRYLQNRPQPLSEPETRGVMNQLVEGLLHLHAHGIIHRDLKLSNVLLTENLDLKIADFGLAARINAGGGEQKTMCGTPNYISPEIISRQPYGLAADVWSLGCMFVTFLTGKPPFESQKVRSTLDKVSRAEYTLPGSLSTEAKDLTRHLLQLDPKKRLPLESILRHQFFGRDYPIHRLKNLDSWPRLLPKTLGQKVSRSAQYSDQHCSSQNRQEIAPMPSTRIRNLEIQERENWRPESVASNGRKSPRERERTRDQLPTPGSHFGLKPFSTARLKSIRQATRHGVVEIVPQAQAPGKPPDLLLAFANDRKIIGVTGDGLTITIYQRLDQCHMRCGQECQPEHLSHALGPGIASHDLEKLPPKYVKRYKYASKFVALVRSKTPKIVFYSPQAKCVLMENGPAADFEMTFYNGVKVHNSVAHSRLEIRRSSKRPNGDEDVFILDTSARTYIQKLPPELVLIVRHVQECLRICVDVEKSGKVEENERNGGSWPLILKSSAAEDAVDFAFDSVPATSSDFDGFRSADSRDGPGSLHPSSMSVYSSDGGQMATGRWSSALSSASSRQHCPSLRAGSAPSVPVASRRHEAAAHERKARSLPSTAAPVPLVTGLLPSASRLFGHGQYRQHVDPPQHRKPGQPETEPVASYRYPGTSTQAGRRLEKPKPDLVAHSGSTVSTSSTAAADSLPKFSVQIHPSAPPASPPPVPRAMHTSTTSSTGSIGLRLAVPAYAFMDGVGWCVKGGTAKETDEMFTMLFMDGTRMVVQVKRQVLVWHERRARRGDPAEERGMVYPIDKSLPGFLKAKLTHFPAFIKLFENVS